MNSSNQTTQNLEYWYRGFGSTPATDNLYVYLLTPLSALSFSLNLISFFILLQKKFQKLRFYTYLRCYVLNNAIISLILTFTFTNLTYRVFNFTNSYGTMLYGGNIQFPLLLSFYYLISLFEICILLERIKFFLPTRFKNLIVLNSDNFCYILLLYSLLINLPNYFVFVPSYVNVELENNSFYCIYFMSQTEFSHTTAFKAINYLFFAIRDVLTLLAKLILNIIAIILVKQYMLKLKKEKEEFANKISSQILHSNKTAPASNETFCYISKMQRNQIYLALIKSTFFNL